MSKFELSESVHTQPHTGGSEKVRHHGGEMIDTIASGTSRSVSESSVSSVAGLRQNKSIFQDVNTMNHPDAEEEYASRVTLEPKKGFRGFAQRVTTAAKKNFIGKENKDVPMQLTNDPQIVLEVISGRAAGWIILLTYLVAAVSFSVDSYITYQNLTQSEARVVSANYCADSNVTLANSRASFGCYNNNTQIWTGLFVDMYDVISVNLQMTDSNYTLPTDTTDALSAKIMLQYNAQLWACDQTYGCADDFSSTYKQDDNTSPSWQKVLTMDNVQQQLILASKPNAPKRQIITSSFEFFNIFQNQEALPTNSQIRSYLVKLTFLDADSIHSMQTSDSTLFQFYWDHRSPGAWNVATTIVAMIMFVCTIGFLIYFTMSVNKFRKNQGKPWLAEQKWFVYYAVLVLFYQNPVYLVQNLAAPDAASALVSYICSFFAQSMFLVIWLLYADSINQYSYSWKSFYLPKILYGVVVFLSSAVMIAYQFPTFTIGSTRSPVLASYNWPKEEKDSFVWASMTFLSLYMFWALVWGVRLVLTYRQLNALPYMSTRFQQLLFRFFVLQASLVAVYYILQYSEAIYLIGHKELYKYTSDSFADGVNTLFRQQTQLFGKTTFLTAYVGILGFLLLPAKCITDDFSVVGTQIYALNAKEHDAIVENRTRGDKVPLVFCVELALSLLCMSWCSYGDGLSETKDDIDKSVSELLAADGYMFIESIMDVEFDSFCVIARHVATNTLVVGFRGTQSKKNMQDNLDYGKRYVNWDEMSLPELDAEDGLNPIIPMGHVEREGLSSFERSSESTWTGLFTKPLQFFGKDRQSSKHENNTETPTVNMNRSITSATPPDINVPVPPQSPPVSANIMKNGVKNVLDVISKGGDMITDVAKKGENLLVGAVATLGLDLYSVGLHKGFLNIYLSTRIQMHRIVRKELMRSPAPVYVTGHSMGGACASLATLDISINTLPRVKAYLESTEVHKNTQIPITMYNFGSPRVGDKAYRKLYNSTCPASFRVVCDGDVVTGVPKNLQGFKHACTQILIDANALGNIIIDPSFVERWLRLRKGISVKAHLMQTYRSGLEAVIRCTTLVRAMAKQVEDGKKTKDELVRDLMNLANEGRILDADTSSSLFPKIEEEHSVESPVHAEEDVKYPRSSLESPRNSEIENGGEKRNSLRSSSHRGSRGSIDFVNSVSMGSFG